MFYFFLFCLNFLFVFFIYFLLRKKIDKALSLKEVENNLNELVVAFNRNAEVNIRLFEDKKVAMESLMKRANEVLKQYPFLNSQESFFIPKESLPVGQKKYEETVLPKKNKKTKKIVVEKNKQDFLSMKKIHAEKMQIEKIKIEKMQTKKEQTKKIQAEKIKTETMRAKKMQNEKMQTEKMQIEKVQTDREKIFFLMSCDLSEREIAKKLHLPLSEVRLVVGVEKNCSEKEFSR